MREIKLARIISGKSQWQVSQITGIPNYKISLIENERVIPTEYELSLLIEALGVKAEALEGVKLSLSKLSGELR
jgi:transcriptional regulator with XRE-family HTH domain